MMSAHWYRSSSDTQKWLKCFPILYAMETSYHEDDNALPFATNRDYKWLFMNRSKRCLFYCIYFFTLFVWYLHIFFLVILFFNSFCDEKKKKKRKLVACCCVFLILHIDHMFCLCMLLFFCVCVWLINLPICLPLGAIELGCCCYLLEERLCSMHLPTKNVIGNASVVEIVKN